MRKNDKAFLLRMIKYGDTSAVLDFFTQNSGRIQLMGKGVMNQKKRQNLFLLSENEIEYGNSRNADSLGNSYKITPITICAEAYANPIVANLLLFVAEFYVQNTENNHQDNAMYSLLEWSVSRLESGKNIRWFPQEFLHHWGIIGGSDWQVLWKEALMMNNDKECNVNLYPSSSCAIGELNSKQLRRWAFQLTLQVLKEYDLVKSTDYKSIDVLFGG
tara:strand:+ start:155021 stop:155671 length:651 start_codon:yes stop_codon:yes gene_type:complete